MASSSSKRSTLPFVLAGAGALILLAGAVFPWWRLIEGPEPLAATVCRAASLLLAALTVSAAMNRARAAERLLWAGAAAVALPLLLLLWTVYADPPGVSGAVLEANQAARLITDLSNHDIYQTLPWHELRQLSGATATRSEYTLVDGLESVAMFARTGWYATLLAGLMLLPAAWICDGARARAALARGRAPIAAAVVLVATGCLLRSGMSFWMWNRARADESGGDYARALIDYKRASWWDPRLDYDLVFHFEVGRLYSRLGVTWEPDYWAYLGDVRLRSDELEAAYDIYRHHISDPYANPSVRMRYAATLYKAGTEDYNSFRPGDAIEKWQLALKADPSSLETLYALAMGYTRVGEYAEGAALWKRVIDLNEGVGMFGLKYFTADDYRKVITGRAWSKLGWCYYQLHQYGAAMICRANSGAQGRMSLAGLP